MLVHMILNLFPPLHLLNIYLILITHFDGVRYFYKMYKLIDMLCVYKTLILKYEELNSSNHNSSSTS